VSFRYLRPWSVDARMVNLDRRRATETTGPIRWRAGSASQDSVISDYTSRSPDLRAWDDFFGAGRNPAIGYCRRLRPTDDDLGRFRRLPLEPNQWTCNLFGAAAAAGQGGGHLHHNPAPTGFFGTVCNDRSSWIGGNRSHRNNGIGAISTTHRLSTNGVRSGSRQRHLPRQKGPNNSVRSLTPA
jgi:hypothetical protein